MKEPKWLYRLESTDDSLGLWYNAYGEYVFTLSEVENCQSKDLPMEYDERYKQDGRNWNSSCSQKEDITYWYSEQNAKDLVDKGFRFSMYLATEYVEYEKETIFIKDTCLDRVTLDVNELFS